MEKSSQIADYLESMASFAHEGYLADDAVSNVNSTDITGLMASTIEEIDHEKQAISSISDYASSTDSNISRTAQLLVVSEADVISKQQQVLNIVRQLSNGSIPSDMQYAVAQVQVAQSERNDNIILVSQLLPAMTMDMSSITSSSTAPVGPLDPSGALNAADKSAVNIALHVDFGDSLISNQNDIFLLLAQEIGLLLDSPTYTSFHDAWATKVATLPN